MNKKGTDQTGCAGWSVPLLFLCNKVRFCVSTVLPAKSDSDVMFCLPSYEGLRIDRLLVYESYPQDRIHTQVIYQFRLAQIECTS